MQRLTKHILFFLILTLITSSCRSKKTFNGIETLKCTSFEEKKIDKKSKKNTKYEIVVLKDGKRIETKKEEKKQRIVFLNKKRPLISQEPFNNKTY